MFFMIIGHLEKLKSGVKQQNIVFTAQCSILAEALLPNRVVENMRLGKSNVYCVHHICPQGCTTEKLPTEMRDLTEDLKKFKFKLNKKMYVSRFNRKFLFHINVNLRNNKMCIDLFCSIIT